MSDRIKHSEPISIPNRHSHSRGRSTSFSASSSDDDSNSPPLRTPTSTVPPPRVNTSHSPSTSPILSYFFQSPTKVASVIPQSPTSGFTSIGRGFSAKAPQEQPIMEEDEDQEPAIVRHARRMSTSAGWAPTAAPRFNPASNIDQTDRGAGLLRRLSLGGVLVRPQPASPPNQHAAPPVLAPAPSLSTAKPSPSPGRKKRRASTLGVPGEGVRPRRSPSPMGERILKGHFDGFN